MAQNMQKFERFGRQHWMGILGDMLLDPVVLPNRLTGATYLNLLENTMGDFLDDIHLNQMWFKHDGHEKAFVRNFWTMMGKKGRTCIVACKIA